ncbi:acyltransferase [Pseudomonas sp. MS19]|uniref:acyltransferase family protein n=1 Tax=Pseudomonas sp. MS19 TaxID=2579939 RepID=UPI00156279A7|nr:acyltransferase [Pseudomonas sp. MS19]NRH28346.1 acyltransferase [Pseudomonas sp. MS19]
MNSSGRVETLDYWRGLLAISVMIYHFLGWGGVPQGSATALGKLGIYAVSMFYIISGCSMAIAYNNSKINTSWSISFALKRVLRIAPMYWIATLLMAALVLIKTSGTASIETPKIIANLGLYFGFYQPWYYIPVGGWSIGNELVFYALFPIALLAARSRAGWYLFALTSAAIYTYFAFFELERSSGLANQWRQYIHPANQWLLFVLGMSIPATVRYVNAPRKAWIILAAILALVFFSFPVAGDQIVIVQGINRISLTTVCFLLCVSIYGTATLEMKYISKVLSHLGKTSYSIYMLHGAAAFYALYFIDSFYPEHATIKTQILLFIVAPAVVILSSLTFKFIEAPIMRIGKTLITKTKASRLDSSPT